MKLCDKCRHENMSTFFHAEEKDAQKEIYFLDLFNEYIIKEINHFIDNIKKEIFFQEKKWN